MDQPDSVQVVMGFWPEIIGRLILAALLGGIVGLDRETAGKPAGLRTNMLICVGAALLTQLSIAVARTWGMPQQVVGDPGRIAAQIVSGIGFIGAGTIIRSRGDVKGLTTAASLWVVAAIGMAAGAGAYILAGAATGVVLATLYLLGKLEVRLEPYVRMEHTLNAVLAPGAKLHVVESRLKQRELRVGGVVARRREDGAIAAKLEVAGRRRDWENLVSELLEDENVRSVSLE